MHIMRKKYVIGVIIFICFSISTMSLAETINYTYDTTDRLIRAEYGDGTVVEYVYDLLGNRLQKTTTLPGGPTNNPPNAATDPDPPNGSTGVTTDPTLSWTGGGDPDTGDDVAYYLYAGSSTTPQLVTSGWQISFTMGQLRSLTKYYWKVVSRDSHNANTEGPLWSFTTRNDPPVADFEAGQTEGVTPFTVVFTDLSASFDDEIQSWAWDFNNDGVIDSTLQHPSHTYAAEGTFTVSLTVSDIHGATGAKSKVAYISVFLDTDRDGWVDPRDNCPYQYNPDQSDADTDGIGDVCEPDADGDGILNESDNCPTVSNPNQEDANGDGYGDVCTIVHCVATSPGLQAVLDAARLNGKDDVIKLVQGTYSISGNSNNGFNYSSFEPKSIEIKGGYSAGCSSRELNSLNTILDGEKIEGVSVGGVLFISDFGNSPLTKIILEGVTIQNGRSFMGGGLSIITNSASVTLRNNVVRGNRSSFSSGGGLQISSIAGTVTLAKNIVMGNEAEIGAGLSITSTLGNVVLTDNLVSGNKANNYVGGVMIDITSRGNIDLIHNTITGNSVNAPWGFAGGVYSNLGDSSTRMNIFNNIIWGNAASAGGDIFLIKPSVARVDAYYNDFDPAKVSGTFTNAGGNVNLNPLFVDAVNGNYHLFSVSPLIDKGQNTNGSSEDFEGHIRPYDGDGEGTAIVDIGADEYYGNIDDSDQDGLPDPWETARFGNLSAASNSTDYDNDGLSDRDEYQLNTDPKDADTDGDGLSDGQEVAAATNPLVNDAGSDPDKDGFTNQQELTAGSNPFDLNSIPGSASIHLYPGFNLISIPAEMRNSMDTAYKLLPALGNDQEIDRFFHYNGPSGNYEEAGYKTGNIVGINFSNKNGEAHIIYSKVEKVVTFTSKVCPTWDLAPGLNLVGTPCAVGKKAFELLRAIGDEMVVSSIQRFNPATGQFETAGYENGQPAGVNFSVQAGDGYFIYMKQEVGRFKP